MRLLQGMPRGGLQCLLMAFLMFDVCYPSSLKIKCSDLKTILDTTSINVECSGCSLSGLYSL